MAPEYSFQRERYWSWVSAPVNKLYVILSTKRRLQKIAEEKSMHLINSNISSYCYIPSHCNRAFCNAITSMNQLTFKKTHPAAHSSSHRPCRNYLSPLCDCYNFTVREDHIFCRRWLYPLRLCRTNLPCFHKISNMRRCTWVWVSVGILLQFSSIQFINISTNLKWLMIKWD